MNIRRAMVFDLPGVVRLYDDTHEAERRGIITTGWLPGVYPVRATAEAALQRGDLFVMEENNQIYGSALINQIQVDVYADCDWIYRGPDEDVSVLHTLAVDPDARGKGAGPAFVRFWEGLAAEQGCSILRIDTNALNKRARNMYAKLGYIESGIVPTVFNGLKNVDLVMMEKFIGTDIQRRLRDMQDVKYADFQMALIPGMERECAIGVRTPQLRGFAKELYRASQKGGDAARRELEEFMGTLPHKYFDEMQLHAFVISEIKDFDTCIAEVERFLPYIDNWATCDQLSPKTFKKHRHELLTYIGRWLGSEHTYTVFPDSRDPVLHGI